jgi:hypothetical protein
MWMRLSDSSTWNDIEHFVQFLLNNGMPVGDIKCFEEVNDVKKFMASCLNDEEFTTLVIQQKWTKYFENSEMSIATHNCCKFHGSLLFSFLSTFEAVVPVIHSCFPFQDHCPNKCVRFPSVGATKFHTSTK